ncbi:MAG: DNA double-strand break repair nuclease NurA, partial [Alkalinema sp. FL-bin-369]|nr:DNA double-strand break repair nuclease NurA [Leptolyngbyaceae cyanobacterium LF-bin-369]
MLDFNQLARQMQGISQHLVTESSAMRQKLDYAEVLMEQMPAMQTELMERQEKWGDRTIFTAAVPIEPIDTRVSVEAAPYAHTVLATDGSQIAPSHHEIAYCYLINTGRIILHYGQGKQPLLDSLPEVFYRPEDLFVSRQWGIRTEEWMSYRRTVTETEVLAELAQWVTQAPTRENSIELAIPEPIAEFIPEPITEAAATKKRSTRTKRTEQLSLLESQRTRAIPLITPSKIPTIAMVDGSLIYWFLEQLPGEARDRILQPILTAWRQLQSIGVPMVGYISASRSGESLNFFRFLTCPYTSPDCQTHCSNLPDKAPCQVLEPLRDAAVWARLLNPGQRSPLWRSSAKIQDYYEEQCIYFCYLHVGIEVARVEVPEWVAQDAAMMSRAMSLVIAQVQKGNGYPVALAEAHNQAVVRGGDRSRFFGLLEQQMIRAGLRN